MAPASKSLRRQEQFCLDSMQNMLKFVQLYNEERDMYLIESWRNRLNETFGQFQTIRLKLELIEEEEDEEHHDDENRRLRDEFEKNYVKVIGFLTEAERRAHPPPPPVMQAVASGSADMNHNPF